jgi:pyrimidine-nucleoside phosphorylase
MDPREILRMKRDGERLTPEAIEAFFEGYLAGDIPDYQASALLTTIFMRGMNAEELVPWTRAMLESGPSLDWQGIDGPMVDKHSTGGIGDKVSLPLAPALAACGVRVPMISGRGLGHTGGTLDKLEAIPGLRVALDLDALRTQVAEVGCVIAAQTAELVPADARLYALRDATGLVESIPLIASSILSKKICEGLDALVLDVKFGSGAFLPDVERGRELGRTMVDLAKGFGLKAVVRMTSMEAPLGRAVGHGLEVIESLDCLDGGGPADLRELVLVLGGELLASAGVTADAQAGAQRLAAVLDDGSARSVFERMVAAQGGDVEVLHKRERLLTAPHVMELRAPSSGSLGFAECRHVGAAVAALGGGRKTPADRIDPGVGVVWTCAAGSQVSAGDVLAQVHHAGRGLEQAEDLLLRSLKLDGPAPGPLVAERIA